MNLVNKSSVLSPNNEKVMAIGNRLANLNAYKKSDLEAMSGSQEALETLLQPVAPASASFKRKPYSQSSLHVDSAVSISAVSQQSNSALAPSPALTQPPPPSSTLPAGPIRDDAQMVDFVSSFLFPISFIVFNIIYWMVYLNMQVHSGNWIFFFSSLFSSGCCFIFIFHELCYWFIRFKVLRKLLFTLSLFFSLLLIEPLLQNNQTDRNEF